MVIDFWNKLVNTALIGTDRSSTTFLDDPGIKKYLPEGENSPELNLLEAATKISFLLKSGYIPGENSGSQATFNIIEKLEQVSPDSARDLEAILYHDYEPALPEYLRLLEKNHKRIANEMLPDVLEIIAAKPELWDALNNVIGERGHWLVSQNPDWQFDKSPIKPGDWHKGTFHERLSLLQYLRKQTPDLAIELVESTWEEDSISDKVEFLKILKIGLGPNDERFLEKCLDYRRKEVRKTAAKLLAEVPGSALSERVFERLKNYLSLKRKPENKMKLEVSLPEKCDEGMIRDGVDPGAQWFKGGVKVSRLGQMIVATNPSKWSDWMKLDPADSLLVFVRSEWSEMLIQALIEASAVHKADEWIKALLDFGFEIKDNNRFQGLNFLPLYSAMSENVFQYIAAARIVKEEELLPEGHLACQILKNTNYPWSDKLTLSVTSALSRWMGFETSRYWNGWHYRSILKKAAYLARPGIAPKLEFIWPRNSRIWQSWEKEVTDFLDVLNFRKKMNDNILK